jgi:hypothetical protein
MAIFDRFEGTLGQRTGIIRALQVCARHGRRPRRCAPAPPPAGPLKSRGITIVSLVRSFCATKQPVPVQTPGGLAPSIVADAADGADGVMESILTYGRYPDSLWPLSRLSAFPTAPRGQRRSQSRECGGRSAPAAADQRVRAGSLASRSRHSWCHSSTFSRASSRSRNQWRSRHSSRTVANRGVQNAYHTHGLAKESVRK